MKKPIITFIILISIFYGIFAQEYYPFSEEEIKELANKMSKLESSDSLKTELISEQKKQINNLKEIIILDSLELSYKDREIQLYKGQLEKKEPSIWEKVDEEVYFLLGFGLALGGSWMVKNVIENEK